MPRRHNSELPANASKANRTRIVSRGLVMRADAAPAIRRKRPTALRVSHRPNRLRESSEKPRTLCSNHSGMSPRGNGRVRDCISYTRILTPRQTGYLDMYTLSLVLFAIAALAGVAMAVMHFRGISPPRPVLAALHGVFAASGLVTLLLTVLKAGGKGPAQAALGVLLLAAIGGFYLLSFHLRGRPLPMIGVVGHAVIAVAGFVTLLVAQLSLAM